MIHSHTLIVVSSLPLAMRLSLSCATHLTESVCPVRVCAAANVPSSPFAHTISVLSKLPLTTRPSSSCVTQYT